jgi:hypothetical protein
MKATNLFWYITNHVVLICIAFVYLVKETSVCNSKTYNFVTGAKGCKLSVIKNKYNTMSLNFFAQLA